MKSTSTKVSNQFKFIKGLQDFYFGELHIQDWRAFHAPITYVLTNKCTNAKYIGSSNRPLKRLYDHIMGNGTTTKWFINKDNWQDFDIEILRHDTIEEAQEYETYFIEEFNTIEQGYNKSSGVKTKITIIIEQGE